MIRYLTDHLEVYSKDRTPGHQAFPDIVVIADNENDISDLCKLVSKYKVPLTVRAAGSGTTGGALPVNGGVVLSLERLNKIKELDLVNKMIVVEPGVITGDIHKLVQEKMVVLST